MEFNLPTTKEEMYVVLAELFNHYRVRKEGYEETELIDLELERLNTTQESDSELLTKAQKLLKAQHEREIKNYETELSSKIVALQEQISLLERHSVQEVSSITNLYKESVKKVQNQAIKSGLLNSSIIVDKTALLEDSKNQKIAQVIQEKNDKVAIYTAEIEQLNAKLASSADYFKAIHQCDVDKMFIELCEDREKKKIEVFKYNNSLDEKEQRHSNSIKETKSSLYLRFLDIKAAEYTKDQLVDMGYFKDVIKCISAYFDTLEPLAAYHLFLAEKELVTFLDYYYEQVALVYKLRAGV